MTGNCCATTGRWGSRVTGVMVAALMLGSCQRAGMEGVEPPEPAPDESATQVTEHQLPAGAHGRLAELLGPSLSLGRVEVGRVDPILHARVGQDGVHRQRVAFWQAFWTTRSRGHFERYLERMGIYQDLVDAELEARGLPWSLRYLPVVESGYHHSVRSRAGATGLWQLMPSTARELGLLVNGIVDDRRDPIASTHAALNYLTFLHREFDSWFLALAAYNAGPGRVGRLLQRHAPDPAVPGDERYLRIRAHLPAETRDFVPRFFAAAALASDPERYGLPPVPTDRTLVFDEVTVPDATSLDVVAEAAGVDEGRILELNPQYMRGFTPPGRERVVRVPPGVGDTFVRNYALIPPSERISFMEHQVARGETLSHIARRYGVSVGELQGSNGNVDPRRLQIGQRLVVPVGRAQRGGTRVAQAGATASEDNGGRSGSQGAVQGGGGNSSGIHVVSSGESLWTISRRYGMSVNELRQRNGLREGAVLRPGQELQVSGDVRTHRVRRGDTWGALARRYGVSTEALARVNGRSPRDVIRVGEELSIPN
jgi:membrane-bound lytic murein transglycosylase D